MLKRLNTEWASGPTQTLFSCQQLWCRGGGGGSGGGNIPLTGTETDRTSYNI